MVESKLLTSWEISIMVLSHVQMEYRLGGGARVITETNRRCEAGTWKALGNLRIAMLTYLNRVSGRSWVDLGRLMGDDLIEGSGANGWMDGWMDG